MIKVTELNDLISELDTLRDECRNDLEAEDCTERNSLLIRGKLSVIRDIREKLHKLKTYGA